MILVICGPTCSGKTKLSLYLAKKYKGIILNADATQIYRGLDIGSAKIKEEEKENIPHYLFDIALPNQEYTVKDYQKDARYLLDKYKDKLIIIVGGTGLYINSTLYDYEFLEYTKRDYSNYTNFELYEMCKNISKDVDIHENNRVRLESFLNKNGNTKSSNKLLYEVKFIGLKPDREELYQKINERVDEMFEIGLLEEVSKLYKKYGSSNILKRAIGYKETIDYLNNKLTFEETKSLIKQNTRHFAKRQFTWFNNKLPVVWFKVDYQDFSKTCFEVDEYLKNS